MPDIMGKLPGRGVWVTSARTAVTTACASGGFARGFKSKVIFDGSLEDSTERLLTRRVLGLIGMARKSGHIHIGFDQVKAAAGSGKIAWRIEASDGSSDGRGKIRTLSKAVARELGLALPRVIGCFSNKELARAIGRESAVHMALPPGPLANSFGADVQRLAGFMDLIPPNWEDYAHEMRDPPQKPS